MTKKRRCLFCGYDDPSGLVERYVCRDHLARLQGRSILEQDHILGRRNCDDVASISPNLHAYKTPKLLSFEKMLKGSNIHSPLNQVALAVFSIGTCAEWFAKHFRRFAYWLIALNSKLTETWGERWWEKLDLGPLYIEDERTNHE